MSGSARTALTRRRASSWPAWSARAYYRYDSSHPVGEPVDTPGFSGTGHQYGQPYGGFPAEEDEHWAGRGYDQVPDEATLEAVVVPA